jgi:hypothetical protein
MRSGNSNDPANVVRLGIPWLYRLRATGNSYAATRNQIENCIDLSIDSMNVRRRVVAAVHAE